MKLQFTRSWRGPGAVAAWAALAMGPAHAADDLTVIEAVWARGVANRQYVGRVASGAQARPLYFWTRLKGGAQALELLAREGKLPITHHWYFSNVFTEVSDEETPEQEPRILPAGAIADTGGLSSLVGEGGSFYWRTWSLKQAIQGGVWSVTVKYADGEPVLCTGKPCRWQIELK